MTLDLEKGGGVASNLEALYGYMLLRLPDVDVNSDVRVAEEVIELLEPLRGSWSELARTSADITRSTSPTSLRSPPSWLRRRPKAGFQD